MHVALPFGFERYDSPFFNLQNWTDVMVLGQAWRLARRIEVCTSCCTNPRSHVAQRSSERSLLTGLQVSIAIFLGYILHSTCIYLTCTWRLAWILAWRGGEGLGLRGEFVRLWILRGCLWRWRWRWGWRWEWGMLHWGDGRWRWGNGGVFLLGFQRDGEAVQRRHALLCPKHNVY